MALLLLAFATVTSLSADPPPLPLPGRGRNVPGVFVSHEPDRVSVLPEVSPRSSEIDPNDLAAVEETATALVNAHIVLPAVMRDLQVVEVYWREATGHNFRPLALSALRTRLNGCEAVGDSVARHGELPVRSFFVFIWSCPGDPPQPTPRSQQLTVISVENHRLVNIYHHSNGAVPVWSPSEGSPPRR